MIEHADPVDVATDVGVVATAATTLAATTAAFDVLWEGNRRKPDEDIVSTILEISLCTAQGKSYLFIKLYLMQLLCLELILYKSPTGPQ